MENVSYIVSRKGGEVIFNTEFGHVKHVPSVIGFGQPFKPAFPQQARLKS